MGGPRDIREQKIRQVHHDDATQQADEGLGHPALAVVGNQVERQRQRRGAEAGGEHIVGPADEMHPIHRRYLSATSRSR